MKFPRFSRLLALAALVGSVRAQTPFSSARPESATVKLGAGASTGASTARAKATASASHSGRAPAVPSATSTVAALVGGNDNCALADPISGFGNFAVDTTTATGTLSNGVCAPPNNDVWFAWTATSTGPTQVSLCGLTGVDTVIAVWSSGVCPPTSLVACNDDFCGTQSQVQFPAVSGTTYLFELGAFGAATTYVATFNVQPPQSPPANDDCSTPSAVVGAGPFAYDNTLATTGTQGQTEPLCVTFGTAAITKDLWFCWTAPSSGSFDLSTVGVSAQDTRLAVYDACGCPTAAALACDDDSCNTLQSTATFDAIGGNTYTVQIGSFPGAPTGPSAFTILPSTTSVGCAHDDGTSENAIGLAGGGQALWLMPFGSIGAQTLVSSVSAAYGTPLLPGATPPAGTPVSVCLYDDPNDDGDPSDAILVSQTPAVVGNVDNDILDVYAVPPAVLNGVFFAGVAITHNANQFPASLDASFCGSVQAWIFGSTAGTLDFFTLSNNVSSGITGSWLVRAGCSTSSATSFCGNGDPNRIPCPCGNNGTDPAAGCANSQNAAGARMSSTGFAATDDVVLNGTGMSGTICIFIRTLGPQQTNGAAFGDGITCTGGSLLRLRAVGFVGGVNGTASFPVPPETVTLSARSGTFPGSGATMQYSGFYRNAAAAFCPPLTFNTHNTLSLTW